VLVELLAGLGADALGRELHPAEARIHVRLQRGLLQRAPLVGGMGHAARRSGKASREIGAYIDSATKARWAKFFAKVTRPAQFSSSS